MNDSLWRTTLPVLRSITILYMLIMLGFFSRRKSLLPPEAAKNFNSFIYYFALPALFFVNISTKNMATIKPVLVIGSIAPIALLVLLLFFCKLFKIVSKNNYILLNLSIAFSSSAFFGVPFFEEAMGDKGLGLAIITSSFLAPTGIVLSLIFFEFATHQDRSWRVAGKIFQSPLIISIGLGFFCSFFNIRIPLVLEAGNFMGKTALGLAVFSLGMFIHDHLSWEIVRKGIKFSLFRIFTLPAATFIILFFFSSLTSDLRMFLFLQSGIPSAISLAIFSQRYQYKIQEVSGIVIMTSLLSFMTLNVLAIINKILW